MFIQKTCVGKKVQRLSHLPIKKSKCLFWEECVSNFYSKKYSSVVFVITDCHKASRLPDFLEKYGSIERLFPPSEQLLMTEYLLYSTSADSKYFPGCQVKETLVQWLERRNYLLAIFPLHNEEHLKKSASLMRIWNILRLEPFTCEELRDYFGDEIALYFTFHACYLSRIIPLAILGCLTWFLESYYSSSLIGAVFCLCAVIWSVFFLESWKRTNAQVCHRWSFIEMGQAKDWMEEWKEDIRTEYFGDWGIDPITGEQVLVYPYWKRLLRITICWLIVVWILLISIGIMFAFTQWEGQIEWKSSIPTLCYVLVVYVLEYTYTHIAEWLTQHENHKTQTEFENHQVAKLVIFQFFNMNMSLLYSAFFERDFFRLRSSLSSSF
ncbi:uncharacterized protein Gasu_62570 [Galdieria sulphuraria]|uniref:Anoctamin transmembrane domain-containing protein n=1 Tax=Galdieria sulphuraria TaxID=130081 RepID=M2X8B9_GALSU|nr:uncharacterized protein Gasu_62570 [Galdieria sulphuraria]EME26092.1 hypothetical protein Gasu_62570 [Galdieria sulphuraria]|eukprot:XP_005702612.1 hypothetical protein Gasu_62570 [Galdieria sulphuraria]